MAVSSIAVIILHVVKTPAGIERIPNARSMQSSWMVVGRLVGPMVRSFLGREQDHAQQFVNDFQDPCGGQ
jgi:hypothetical protein